VITPQNQRITSKSNQPEANTVNEPIGEFDSMIRQTIYQALAEKLGRTPTHEEIKADVKRILQESLVELASKGKLGFQRAATYRTRN
jgi:hypothetical protein